MQLHCNSITNILWLVCVHFWSFKIDLKEKKQRIFYLMYIILLKVYYSSFSAFTACMFDWLIDGRSLVKTKLNHLINSVYFRVRSITKTCRYWCETRKLHCESTEWKAQYMVHEIWEIKYQFTDLHDGAHPDSHVTAFWTVHIVKNDIYFLPYRFTNINFCQ